MLTNIFVVHIFSPKQKYDILMFFARNKIFVSISFYTTSTPYRLLLFMNIFETMFLSMSLLMRLTRVIIFINYSLKNVSILCRSSFLVGTLKLNIFNLGKYYLDVSLSQLSQLVTCSSYYISSIEYVTLLKMLVYSQSLKKRSRQSYNYLFFEIKVSFIKVNFVVCSHKTQVVVDEI